METSSPRKMRREDSTNHRSHHRRNQEHSAHETLIYRPLAKRYDMYRQHDTAGENSRGAKTSDGTTDDESGRFLRDAADERTEFADGDAGEEDQFWGVEGVDSAVEELEGAACYHVCACVPSDVADGVEDIGDLGDGCGDDCAVLRRRLPFGGQEGKE
jgi:hypothetical protein